MKTIGRVTSFDFYSKLIIGNRLPNHCNWLHKAFLWKDVTLHNWIWISTFKHTSNWLPKSCNRLHHFEINWNVVNSVESFWKQTLPLVIDYRNLVIDYQRVKNSGNLENFVKTSFEKQNCAMFVFWKIFSILPLWSLLDFFSWNLNSSFLES